MSSYITGLLKKIVSTDETPKRLALSFTIGTFLSFSPPLGIHTILGLSIAYLFHLNRTAMVVGVYLNNPWTIVPYYAFATWVGIKITGMPEGVQMPHVGLREIMTRAFWMQIMAEWRILIPAVVGSLVLALLIALVTYPIMLHLIGRYQKQRRLRAQVE
ncbi:MAG TPA: DUF2062 domain-containing protein [Acidobacteriota bacterium]|nr:DUF2062 domain-containing protein [Acidobacteriota bacterium]